MTADARRTEREDSRPGARPRTAPNRAVLARTALATAGGAGALLLALATWLTVIQIRVGTVERLDGLETSLSGWDRHGPALVLLALAALPMLYGALRGARPAMLAVAALGAVALVIAVAQDLPDVNETGQVGQLYADATARAAAGFYAETLGAVLLVLAGGGLLLLGGAGGGGETSADGGAREGRRTRRAGRSARRAPDQQRPADGAVEP